MTNHDPEGSREAALHHTCVMEYDASTSQWKCDCGAVLTDDEIQRRNENYIVTAARELSALPAPCTQHFHFVDPWGFCRCRTFPQIATPTQAEQLQSKLSTG